MVYNFEGLCLSVCLFVSMYVCHTITFESLDVRSSCLHIRCTSEECGSSSYTKVIGSRSRSHEHKNVHCYPATIRFSERTNTTAQTASTFIGVDLAGILRGRMASAKGGLVPSGVRCGEGCPLHSRLGGLGENHELRNRILAYFEGYRTLLFVPI